MLCHRATAGEREPGAIVLAAVPRGEADQAEMSVV